MAKKLSIGQLSETDVRRLDLIRRARALDMTLAEVRELVVCAGAGTRDDF